MSSQILEIILFSVINQLFVIILMKGVCLEYVHLSIFFSSSFFLFWPVWKPEVDVFFVGGHRLPWGFYSRLFCLHCGTSRIFGNILSFLAHIYIFTCILHITRKNWKGEWIYSSLFPFNRCGYIRQMTKEYHKKSVYFS